MKSQGIISLVLFIGSAFAQTVVPWDQSTKSAGPKSGSIDSGNVLPHFAAGQGAWLTEFEIFSLEDKPVPFTMEVFDGSGQRQTLELLDIAGTIESRKIL